MCPGSYPQPLVHTQVLCYYCPVYIPVNATQMCPFPSAMGTLCPNLSQFLTLILGVPQAVWGELSSTPLEGQQPLQERICSSLQGTSSLSSSHCPVFLWEGLTSKCSWETSSPCCRYSQLEEKAMSDGLVDYLQVHSKAH